MGQLNFGHIDHLCKATHLDGMTPFWSPWLPLQGDITKWGDPIFDCLGHLCKATHLDGVTQFQSPWLPSQANTLKLGDPISTALGLHSGNIKIQNPCMDRATKFYNHFSISKYMTFDIHTLVANFWLLRSWNRSIMVICFEYKMVSCEFWSLSNLKMYNIPTFALYQLNFYRHNHGLYNLWLFDSHIECLMAYHILSYKASQIPLSFVFSYPF